MSTMQPSDSIQISGQNGKLEHIKKWLHELAVQLICAHPEEIDQEINDCLKIAGEAWGFDRVYLTELSEDLKNVEVTHAFQSSSPALGSEEYSFIGPDDDISWLVRIIQNGESIFFDQLQDISPSETAAGKIFFRNKNIGLAIFLPLSTRESTQGTLILASTSEGKTWDDSMDDIRYLSQVLAGSIDRGKRAKRIKELQQFEGLLAEISAKYINMPTDEIEGIIKNDFEKLGLLLGADRFNLYLISEDRRNFIIKRPFAWWPHEDDSLVLKVAQRDIETPNFFDRYRYFFNKWLKGQSFQFASLDDLPKEAETIKKLLRGFGVKSHLSVPITVAGSTAGVLVVVTTHSHRIWSDEIVHRLQLFGEVFVNAMVRKQSDEKLKKAFLEIKQLKDQIETDYVYLQEEISLEHNFGDIVGRSNALKNILLRVKQVAPTDATVLILGETGTGKGIIARAVHDASRRNNRPFMQVNCAALTPSLIESELFGYERGAFTGAQVKRIGRFELAHGTTLFLDEIGELPPELQSKLLRVLQDGEIERVGGNATIKTDVRVVAATNKDIEKEVETGRFRRDLWYRLNVFPIFVPPLRERMDDVPVFVSFFVDKYSKLMGKTFNTISQKAIKDLQAYSWPGNIRELENVIERAVITSPDGNLQIEMPINRPEAVSSTKGTLGEFEREYILKVLKETLWRINGPGGAAKRLGMNPNTLRFRMIKLGIKRPTAQSR